MVIEIISVRQLLYKVTYFILESSINSYIALSIVCKEKQIYSTGFPLNKNSDKIIVLMCLRLSHNTYIMPLSHRIHSALKTRIWKIIKEK